MRQNREAGPPFVKIAGCVLYRRADLDAWLIHYNTERPHLGYRNQGRRPIETINLFVSQEA